MAEQQGLRYNTGKLRYELIPTAPIAYLADVYTRGAHKYSIYEKPDGTQIKGSQISYEDALNLRKIYDGADNWRNGLSWKETMAAAKRHIAAWDGGEDKDKELGTWHLANASWALFALMEFYHTHPEVDDRDLPFLQPKRIGTDIDDVLADFIGAFNERMGIKERPKFWEYTQDFMTKYETVLDDEEFWTTLKPIVAPSDLKFEPVVYITSRPEKLRKFTERWLFEVNKYPVAAVEFASNKLELCKKYRVERFIDDKIATFVTLNANKIPCYLFDSSHNQYVDVGFRRINKETINSII